MLEVIDWVVQRDHSSFFISNQVKLLYFAKQFDVNSDRSQLFSATR